MGTNLGRTIVCVAATLVVLSGVAGCSDDGDSPAAGSQPSEPTSSSSTTEPAQRPDGSSADLSEELTGGNGPFVGAATGTEVPQGYVEHEYVASGTATDYAAVGELDGDGEWTFEPGTEADYRTRVLVRRPEDPADASRTVVLEWLNVSGGVDANPEYASLSDEIVREGHTWVGVSAQLIGVQGGPVLVAAPGTEEIVGKGLVRLDPQRYGSLSHPGDGFSFDIFTQVARAVREGGDVTPGVEPEVVLAAGESQSALALTTYYNGVQPLTRAFDGFLVHSRAYAPLPLVAPGEYADLTGAMTSSPEAVLLRSDLDAPVLELQAEGDVTGVLNSYAARQADTDRFRLWEVAGTSHADASLLGPIADSLGCGVPINDGPMNVVAKAALHSLEEWVRAGEVPATAERLEVVTEPTAGIARDDDGIAIGGVRTPPVDVPVEALSGEPGPSDEMICLLMGSTLPLPPERLAELYESPAGYSERFEADAQEAVRAGFVLDADRAALIEFAHPELVPG